MRLLEYYVFICPQIVFCLSEALMLRNKHNVFTSDYLASTKRILHIVITLVGCGMTVSGTIRKFSGREKHFVTLHGRLGNYIT